MANVYKGKSAAEWGALGKFGKARAASRGGQTGKEWRGEGADPYKRSDVMADIQKDANKLKNISKQTKQFQDWTQGASGFSDVYRKGKADEIAGPEYGIPDVDIHGYPDDWTQKAGTKDGQSGQYITTDKGHKYFKPKQEQSLGGGGDTSTGGAGDLKLETVLKPDQTPALREITSNMDLRSMIANVIDTNNPLFKIVQTKALQNQARIGGGRVNASMGRESVVAAMLGKAEGIAIEVVNTFKEAMHKYADSSDALKLALNNAYYQEMLARVNNSNQVTLREMTEVGFNWRAVLEAKAGAAQTKTPAQFERYMGMFKNLRHLEQTYKYACCQRSTLF